MLKNISLPTALVMIATVAAFVALIILGKPVPAALSGLLGTILAGCFPALLGPKVETLTAELMQMEPVAVSLVEHLEQNPDVAARLRAVLSSARGGGVSAGGAPLAAAKAKPTIAEIEAAMKECEGGSIEIRPDGSVHAVPTPKAGT